MNSFPLVSTDLVWIQWIISDTLSNLSLFLSFQGRKTLISVYQAAPTLGFLSAWGTRRAGRCWESACSSHRFTFSLPMRYETQPWNDGTQLCYTEDNFFFFFCVNVHFSTQGRALKTASSLDEGLSLVVSLNPFSNIDYQNNDNLVHLSSKLRTLQVRLI